jgi:hypothetical protein
MYGASMYCTLYNTPYQQLKELAPCLSHIHTFERFVIV